MVVWHLLGCDEMIKRVSCRVVSSVPLGKGSRRLRPISHSNDEHRKLADAAPVDAGRPGNSVVYTSQLVTVEESADDFLVGRILDCYV